MNESITRRAFLRTLTVLGTAALLPPAPAQAASFVPVGKLGAFPVGAVKTVLLAGGRVVFVRRLSAKTVAAAFHALSGACTHKGCPVAWNARDRQFHCPCHGGRFNSAGTNIAGPPPAPLPALPVRVIGGVVLVGV